jgi:hypothetical protein
MLPCQATDGCDAYLVSIMGGKYALSRSLHSTVMLGAVLFWLLRLGASTPFLVSAAP